LEDEGDEFWSRVSDKFGSRVLGQLTRNILIKDGHERRPEPGEHVQIRHVAAIPG
jgi:hypothetical protein